MKGQPFTWGEDNLGCRWREDGMGARRGKKDHANEWTSLSVGSWELVQAGDWACLIGPKMGKIGAALGQKKKTQWALGPFKIRLMKIQKRKYDTMRVK